jgi:drug/metabolite transporter (DMT)-like permease
MTLLAVANILTLLVLARPLLRRVDWTMFRSPFIWLLMLVVAGRAPTNILSARFAMAIYVQLVTLATPFLVVLLGALLFREPIPRYTRRAVLLSSFGSLLMLSSGSGPLGLLQIRPTPSDWLGMALALVSITFLALYMLLIRRSAQHNLSAEGVFGVQLVVISIEATGLSLLAGEDWSRWLALSPRDWGVFALFTLGVFLGANVANISALRRLGAPFVSSMLGWRLVSTLAVAYVLLGEQLTTAWQVLGAIIVLTTITWYATRRRV